MKSCSGMNYEVSSKSVYVRLVHMHHYQTAKFWFWKETHISSPLNIIGTYDMTLIEQDVPFLFIKTKLMFSLYHACTGVWYL